MSGCVDTTPPVTTGTFTRNWVKGQANYDITLTANEPGATYFRVTGGGHVTSGGVDTTDIQEYTGPINVAIDKKGTANFDYYSVDLANNEEVLQTEVLQ